MNFNIFLSYRHSLCNLVCKLELFARSKSSAACSGKRQSIWGDVQSFQLGIWSQSQSGYFSTFHILHCSPVVFLSIFKCNITGKCTGISLKHKQYRINYTDIMTKIFVNLVFYFSYARYYTCYLIQQSTRPVSFWMHFLPLISGQHSNSIMLVGRLWVSSLLQSQCF